MKALLQTTLKIKLIILLSLGMWVPVFGQDSDRLKVISYNIWNGFDWGKDTARYEAFIAWVQEQAPDVFALQELCGYDEAQLKADAEKWGHPYSVLLKSEGYPVGLTSRQPIQLKERMLEELWHGSLHVETYGIDFYVVHLSPSDCAFRFKEAGLITDKIRENSNNPYLILGDFNAHSPADADLDKGKEALLERKRKSDARNDKYQNLRLGAFDYSVVARFLALPAIDVCLPFVDPSNRFSFPAPALIGHYEQTTESVVRFRERIDYILASPELAGKCIRASILTGAKTGALSDHFPVMAEFDW